MANLIVLQCARCGQGFSVKQHRAETARYCSVECQKPRLPDRPCAACGVSIPRRRLKRASAIYCSQACSRPHQRTRARPAIDRFWEKVDKTPGYGRDGDCWIWKSTKKDKDGYGGFTENGKLIRAHVFSYRIHKGEVPKGAFVCHDCDNPSCVNPSHLWLGDATSNNRDKVKKGRQSCLFGEKSGNAKLTEEQVRCILRDDRTQELIAQTYGVKRATIGLIKTRKNWKHLQP